MKSSFNPARRIAPGAHAFLRLALEPQRGKTDVRQRENVRAAIGFQVLLVDELAADTLDLPLQRDLGVVQVNRWPNEALRFAFAQAKDEDEDVSRVQSVFVPAS